jgi:hypothetical protein
VDIGLGYLLTPNIKLLFTLTVAESERPPIPEHNGKYTFCIQYTSHVFRP